jgi:hypothetical protein
MARRSQWRLWTLSATLIVLLRAGWIAVMTVVLQNGSARQLTPCELAELNGEAPAHSGRQSRQMTRSPGFQTGPVTIGAGVSDRARRCDALRAAPPGKRALPDIVISPCCCPVIMPAATTSTRAASPVTARPLVPVVRCAGQPARQLAEPGSAVAPPPQRPSAGADPR